MMSRTVGGMDLNVAESLKLPEDVGGKAEEERVRIGKVCLVRLEL